MYTGPGATPETIGKSFHPVILHVAAHGEFWPGNRLIRLSETPDPVFWRSNVQVLDGPLSGLDESLLRSSLVLSPTSNSAGVGVNDRRLSALELSSLNLIGSTFLVLSACDTGLGAESSSAGVLGFQYAVQTTMVRHALLSLWKLSDEASIKVVGAIYENWISKHQTISDAYTLALRQLSRDQGKPVHPFYWAAFIHIDQDY
jgi:CHAT domain-containing protein